MEQHKLLKRQLEKLHFHRDELPDNLERWNEFIALINKAYIESDQERYMLERSMDISSHEMMAINERLEYAQTLAGLCYWQYNVNNGQMIWSKEVYNLLQIDKINFPPTYQEFIQLISPENRSSVTKSFELLQAKKFEAHDEPLDENIVDYDFEIKIQLHHQEKWFRFILKQGDAEGILVGVMININAKKESEIKIKELNSALLSTARLAGMSEVATTILHNIGNLLNSANVSIEVVKQNLMHLHFQKMPVLIEMIQNNITHLDHYLLNDEKGKLILPYLKKMSEVLEKENQQNTEEIHLLENKMHHIKEIVSMQKSLSGVSGVSEKIILSDLLDNAIEISSIKSADTILTKTIDTSIQSIVSDKSKLLQILTNLIRNAKDAVKNNHDDKAKEINILVTAKNAEFIQIIVKDNGVGVLPENLDRIFTFGFTSKVDGHGFGLHSSALSAKELGGSLNVQSNGVDQGAIFTLILPIEIQKSNGEKVHE